jgi:alpha-galactosidase
MRAPTLAKLEGAGRLERVRVGVRFAEARQTEGSGNGPWADTRLATAPLVPGRVGVGPFVLTIAIDHAGEVATCDVVARNVGEQAARLDAIVVGARWVDHGIGSLRFLRHGWQSWSFTGGRPLDPEGEAPFPSGSWLRGMHHALGEMPEDREGWHESDLVTAVGASPAGAACLAGALEGGDAFGIVYARRSGEAVDLEVEVRLEVPLAAGEEYRAEPVRFALGHDPGALLEAYADALGTRAGARRGQSFQAGWCTWYHFFHEISEESFRRNLETLFTLREELPLQVVQLDDGYQRAIGDWLETNERFPSGLMRLAGWVRDAGFTPGIWTAPFCVVRESRVFEAHPEWLLRQGSELHRGLLHPQWTADASVYVLDTSRDDVSAHLMRTFAALAGIGFPYLKLDFLYAVAMRADAADPRCSRARRLRRGLEAIRQGAGSDAFLLGCGCPLGAAVGWVDGMRIGPDVAPRWEIDPAAQIPGIEPTQPSTRNALRNVLTRAWMHRRLWLNDPDCLLARESQTQLTADEIRSFAAVIAVTGGMVLCSDDVPTLGSEGRKLVRQVIALARSVDAHAPGSVRVLDLLRDGFPAAVIGHAGDRDLAALVNAGDSSESRSIDLGALGVPRNAGPPEALLGTAKPQVVEGDRVEVELPAHASSLLSVQRAPTMAVFCDFDGTFAIQDVGATIARRYAGGRRQSLWARLERGELSAWEYNLEILDGLELPEAELEAFLRTVELSPGAGDLVAWCAERSIPFRVLSDGFDYNLDRLQAIHGVRFAYEANHLHYEGGAWRIEAAHPNPDCTCGTGTCKRGRIEAFRAERPGVLVIHIGNGRVSDLCATEAADLVFAKDSLAETLRERGRSYEPFETLRDVLEALEQLTEAAAE